MSKTTGVILATGGITVINQSVFNNQPFDWKIPIATGIAAAGFSLAERVFPQATVIVAWTALLTVLLTRVNPKVPSPVETASKVLNLGG